MIVSAKDLRNKNRSQGIFHTNENLASYVASVLRDYAQEPIEEIVDLCCGTGGLLKPFSEARKFGCDVEGSFVDYCKENLEGEFIHASCFDKPFGDKKFKYIIGNFPFGVRGNGKEITAKLDAKLELSNVLDSAFILSNLQALEEDGICVLIFGLGFLYRGKKEADFRRYLLENNLIDRLEYIKEDKSFDDTKIPVGLMVLKKNRTKSTIDMRQEDMRGDIDVADILSDETCNLSFSRYLYKPEEQEEVSEVELFEDLLKHQEKIFRAWLGQHEIVAQHLTQDPLVKNSDYIFTKRILEIIEQWKRRRNEKKDGNNRSLFD